MRNTEALEALYNKGVLLESAHGPVPNVAELVAGSEIRGSWWAHPSGKDIFRVTRFLRSSPEVLTCSLLDGKITFVHRRLWPALVRLADQLNRTHLGSVQELHTSGGSHRRKTIAFPDWVPPDVVEKAASMSKSEAEEELASVLKLAEHSQG